jgi:hypothetical protein
VDASMLHVHHNLYLKGKEWLSKNNL